MQSRCTRGSIPQINLSLFLPFEVFYTFFHFHVVFVGYFLTQFYLKKLSQDYAYITCVILLVF